MDYLDNEIERIIRGDYCPPERRSRLSYYSLNSEYIQEEINRRLAGRRRHPY